MRGMARLPGWTVRCRRERARRGREARVTPLAARGAWTAVVLLLTAGCTEPVPPTVYVPAADYAQSADAGHALADSSARAGQWVPLRATVTAGPWRPVPRDSANLEDCWWRRPPPAVDTAAAARVRWMVEPADGVVFNQPRPPSWERTVRFPQPGTYRLWATAPGCGGPVTSDTVVLVVE